MRSAGGKAPGPTGARGVLQTFESLCREALTPLADRMPVTAEFDGDLLIGRIVRASGSQDEATAEGQRLRRRACTSQRFQFGAEFLLEFDCRAEGAWHGGPPF